MSVDFIDANVFIYLFDEADRRKRITAEGIVATALSDGSGLISFQVVQETMNVLVRKLGAPPDDVRRFLDAVLVPLWRVPPSPQLYQQALDLHVSHRFSFYDSLVIAAARHAGCDRLLSEDLQDGQKIGNLRIVNPFAD